MADLAKIVDELSALTVLEAAELSKMLEENGAFPPLPRSLSPLPALRALLLRKKRRNLMLFWPKPAQTKSTSLRKSARLPVWA